MHVFVSDGEGVVDNGTGISMYISCSSFLNRHTQSTSGSLGEEVCSAVLFFTSLILSTWHLPPWNICPMGIALGLQEFVGKCVKVREESHRNEF